MFDKLGRRVWLRTETNGVTDREAPLKTCTLYTLDCGLHTVHWADSSISFKAISIIYKGLFSCYPTPKAYTYSNIKLLDASIMKSYRTPLIMNIYYNRIV